MQGLRLFLLVVLVGTLSHVVGCGGTEVGKRCSLNDENIAELQRLSASPNNVAVLLEPSFECETGLNFCVGSDYTEEKKNDLGYCSKVCADDADCPKDFSCLEFFPVPSQNLPDGVPQSIKDLSEKKLCIRNKT
ncbi:MAG: hypothetical protein H6728_07380 [Myxococcales bacterium]|nr:hypothetical protein [Myxococcales bacterium]MCB9642882.1 hypothetical protein [Myxococcales bacterium]